MRQIAFTIAIIITSILGLSANAQGWESVSKVEYTEARAPKLGRHEIYVTNDWFDNWYFGGAAGVNVPFSSITSARVSPAFDLTLTKWLSPKLGVRFGYQGQWGKEYMNEPYTPYQNNHSPLPFDNPFGSTGTLSYGMFYLHGDLMLNFTNIICGYKHDRIFNCSPYINAGYLKIYDNQGGKGSDREIGAGLGVYSTFRVADRFVITADLRNLNVPSHYKTTSGVITSFMSLTVGVAYNIYRTTWDDAHRVYAEAEAAKELAQAAVEEAHAQQVAIEQLEEIVEAQHDTIYIQQTIIDKSANVVEMDAQALKLRAAAANQVLYFNINSDKLTRTEAFHLRSYVRLQLESQPEHVFYITGSADKSTGTLEYNHNLASRRAAAVKTILMNEFNVKEENIVLKETVVSEKAEDAALDRCVLIESE